MQTRKLEYSCGDTRLVGVLVCPDATAAKQAPGLPGVLVAPDWRGCGDNAVAQARAVAALGYVGFAIDMYGEGQVAEALQDRQRLMADVKRDRAVLMRRIQAALTTLKAQPEVDPGRTGAIGFCFGGLCVIDLARSGAEVAGVVSFHGLPDPPPASLCKPISAKVLVCHGYRDPLAKPEAMLALCQELDAADCDFQLHAYGQTVHSFTNEQANAPEAGTAYHPDAARRSLRSMRDFFADIF